MEKVPSPAAMVKTQEVDLIYMFMKLDRFI